jgi:hypothetical protein
MYLLEIKTNNIIFNVAATLSGSSVSNYGHTATYDNDGNIYTGARNFGVGYPSSSGAFQLNWAGGVDMAISKYDSTGSNLLWATYIGGSDTEYPNSMVVNSQNELCIYGTSSSSDFPTSLNAFDNSHNGSTDIVITHLDYTGSSLIGSSYFGGSNDDGLNVVNYNYGDAWRGEINIDSLDNIIVSSFSSSSNFPTTIGCYQPSIAGGQDAVVMKINSDLSGLIWSTFIGGSADDAAFGIRSINGSIYVSGVTAGAGFPTTSGSAISSYIGGSYDAFVAKFNNQNSNLISSSFFGSTGDDLAYFLDVDSDGDVYLFGQNSGVITNSPSCYGNPNSNQFISKFSSDLSNIEWQTTIGSGSGVYDLTPVAFMVDVCERIYISGYGAQYWIPSLFTSPDALKYYQEVFI